MKSGSLILAALAMCLIAGCAKSPPDQKSGPFLAALGSPPGPSTTWTSCQTGEECSIAVTVKPGDTCYTNDILVDTHVALLENTKRIKWTLPSGYEFCKHAGDGVFLKQTVSEAADPFDDESKRKCSGDFTWKRKMPDGKPYEYLLRFRNAERNLSCVKDPWMRN